MADGGIPHEGTNSVALTFKLDIGALRSSSQLSGAPPDDILESNKMLKNQKKYSNLICVFSAKRRVDNFLHEVESKNEVLPDQGEAYICLVVAKKDAIAPKIT